MNKPLTRTEMKMLVCKKMKAGKSYDEAYDEVRQELIHLNKTKKEKVRDDKQND